jgi:hypothetical protein
LIAFEIRFWNTDALRERLDRPADHLVAADGYRLEARPADAGVREQALDQRIQPSRAVGDARDVTLTPLIELALIALGEQVRESADRAERLRKIV